MMQTKKLFIRSALFVSAVALLALGACSEDAPECAGDPMIMEFTASSTTVAAGGTVDLTIMVHNFNLGEHVHASADTEPANEEPEGVIFAAVNGCLEGHAHVYLDDLMTNPIAMQKMETMTVTIPAETAVGPHTLIARLHTLDHLIVEPQVTKELAIEVE